LNISAQIDLVSGMNFLASILKEQRIFLNSMIDLKIGQKVKWDIQTNVNHVNDELFKLLKEANVNRVALGIEIGDKTKLKNMGKGTKLSDIFLACELARKHQVKIGIFLLFGHPN
jgi:radical SAM superfamily enzyme YgiQ (UPF0313 family)